MTLTFASLFDGLSCFSHALAQAGWDFRWLCELEPDCRRVSAHHFSGVAQYPDVRTLPLESLERVDLIVAGWPCVGHSSAGRKQGFGDARSGLFREVVRVAAALEPSCLLLENVPGLLSNGKGRDFRAVLDSLTQLGYLIDADVLDAQDFGLAQRRRRVFFVCRRIAHLAELGSPDLALAALQACAEICSDALFVHQEKRDPEDVLPRIRWRLDFLAKCPPDALERGGLSSDCLFSGLGFIQTTLSRPDVLEDLSEALCGLAEALALCAGDGARLSLERPHCWGAAESLTLALEAYAKHARQAVSSLFDDVERHARWHVFRGQAKSQGEALRRAREPSGVAGPSSGPHPAGLRELLARLPAVGAGLPGHPAPGEEAQAGAAAPPENGPEGTRPRGPSPALTHPVSGDGSEVMPCLRSNPYNNSDPGMESRMLVIQPDPYAQMAAAQCHGNNVGPVGTFRAGNGNVTGGVPFVAHPDPAGFAETGKGHCSYAEAEATGSLRAAAGGHWANLAVQPDPIAFHVTQDPISSDQVTPVISAGNRTGCGTIGVIHAEEGTRPVKMLVRRITVVEACRLMGLPDDYLDGLTPPLPDGAKFRMLGNSGSRPTIHWLGARLRVIELFDRERHARASS